MQGVPVGGLLIDVSGSHGRAFVVNFACECDPCREFVDEAAGNYDLRMASKISDQKQAAEWR
jgi:hypothetical protein